MLLWVDLFFNYKHAFLTIENRRRKKQRRQRKISGCLPDII